MRIRVFKLFGREVARWESWEQATVSDVVAAMLANRQPGRARDEGVEAEEMTACTCCGEPFDLEEEWISSKFTDLTDRIVWDARADDDD